MNTKEHIIEHLNTEIKRKDAQIREAIAILMDGTDYEKLHVPAILRDALSTSKNIPETKDVS